VSSFMCLKVNGLSEGFLTSLKSIGLA
jgi:hypothetical protein